MLYNDKTWYSLNILSNKFLAKLISLIFCLFNIHQTDTYLIPGFYFYLPAF